MECTYVEMRENMDIFQNQTDEVSAKYENGVLEIILKYKKEKVQNTRKITIN